MITPTNGRIVWYQPSSADTECWQVNKNIMLVAQICHVWNDRCVNLDVTDSNGGHHSRTSVDLLQDDDQPCLTGRYAIWMPYQKGQAAKTEALETEKRTHDTLFK